MSGMRPFIHEIYSIYICLLYSHYLNACVYSQNIPFGQMVDSQRLLSMFACACKTLHYLNLLVAFISHNCQDVFRKYSQNGIAKDWQTMWSLRLKFQISTCERAYSLRAVWPAEEVEYVFLKTCSMFTNKLFNSAHNFLLMHLFR
jgi:hypothetical protein